jgi:gliding motility-associated-like protein
MVVDLSLATPVVLGTQNAADYTVTYHWSQADADDGANDLSLNYYNTTAFSETIFVRIENVLNEDCFDTNSFTLEVNPTPIANLPSNIDICDDNNDGISDVDFDALVTSQVLGSQSATDFEVLYFSSQANADSGENPISMPFTNTANPQEIFVRIQNALNADCFDTNSFFVEVFDTPVANTVADLRFCDDGADGSLTNGQMVVDLSLATPVVLGTQNAADYTVTYHWSQADADDGTNDLSLNYYNTTAFSETIFVRIENVLNEDCFDTNSFTLEVNPIPSSFNSALFQCDEDGFVDGFTLFNCHQADQSLTGNVTGLSTSFYTTLADAQSGTNPIDGYNCANTSNPQVLYVQVKDDNTACFSISELSLEVSTTDVSDAMLVRCDDDGTEDGLASFDLSLADSLVLVSAPAGVTITYYASNQDALLEQNPLVSPFTNTTAYSQNIYARAEDDNACYGISQLLLKVNPLPLLDQDQSVIYCLNNYPSTLTLNAGVIGGSSGLNYQWSNGETSQSIQVNQAGVYTVSVENSNGCTQSRQITVVDSEVATIDNITVSDASQVNSIAVSVSGDGNYEFALDNPLGPYQDLNSFDNVLPGIHTVYVRDKNGCGVTQEMVSVIGFMKFFTPNGDGINDLWQIIGISSQFQPDSKVFIYDRYGKLLIQISPQQGGWNGNYNGYKMPAADYWFHATLQDGRSFKGHFTLKR